MFSSFAFLGIGTTELIIILIILLLLFGAKKLPDLARSLGQSAGELRKGLDDGKSAKDKDESKKS